MQGTFTDIILLVGINVAIGLMILVILFYSDKPKNYRLVSLFLLIPMIILEFPHMLLPDPTNLIDITVHIGSGLALYMVFSNLRKIKKNRHLISLLMVVISILLVELFLSLLEIVYGYVNPIGIDSLEDILWTVFGGIIGFFIFIIYEKKYVLKWQRVLIKSFISNIVLWGIILLLKECKVITGEYVIATLPCPFGEIFLFFITYVTIAFSHILIEMVEIRY